MSTYAIDDAEFIRRRLEEIEADRRQALTGSSAAATQEGGSSESVWLYAGQLPDYDPA